MITKEIIKNKGKLIEVKHYKTKDFRDYIELNATLKAFLDIDESEIKDIVSHIPKSYFKNIEVDGVKIKFCDRLALPMVLHKVDNYELYKFFMSKNFAPINKYVNELYCDTSEIIVGKIEGIENLSKKIDDYNKFQSDILHDLENLGLNNDEKLKLVNELEVMRIERRKHKNDLAFVETFERFFSKNNISRGDIKNLSNEFLRLKRLFNNKTYNPRVTGSIGQIEIKQQVSQKINSAEVLGDERKKQRNLTIMMRKAGIKK